MFLDATNKSVRIFLAGAVATNQAVVNSDWGDNTATTYIAGSADFMTNGTTPVTIVAAPAASTQRIVQEINVYNADTAPMTVTIQTVSGANNRTQIVITLQVGERLSYAKDEGWSVFNSDGARKVTTVTSMAQTQSGLKNKLINGDYRINQVGFAGGALGAGVYGYDMWKAGAGGCNVTANATTGVLTHTSGPLVQVMESPRLAGVAVTVSVGDLTGGSLSVDVDGETATITAGSGRRGATVTVPVGSTGNVTLTLTGTAVTYKEVQLEVGSVATSFESLPIGQQISLCERYFEKSYDLANAPGAIVSNGREQIFVSGLNVAARQVTIDVTFKTRKRATPAVTVYSDATGASGNVRNITTGADFASFTAAIGERGFLAGNASNFAALGEYNMGFHWTADSRL